jgi:hypothetical protein
MLKRLIENRFIEGNVTIGVEFNSFVIRVEGKLIKL